VPRDVHRIADTARRQIAVCQYACTPFPLREESEPRRQVFALAEAWTINEWVRLVTIRSRQAFIAAWRDAEVVVCRILPSVWPLNVAMVLLARMEGRGWSSYQGWSTRISLRSVGKPEPDGDGTMIDDMRHVRVLQAKNSNAIRCAT
jgi:hypothetical protein